MFPMPKGIKNVKLTKKEQKEADKALAELCKQENITVIKKPVKPLDSNFTNNDPLDKLINEMSGAPVRITSKEIRPVLDKKLIELEKQYQTERKAFDDKYDASPEKKSVVAALDAMVLADPDLSVHLTVTSKKVYTLKSKLHSVAHMSKALSDKLTYPANTIEELEKL